MKRIHIVGRKNHGKTTLIVELLAEFARRGLPVGAIKHTSHRHELDTPGKDSYHLRKAGANPVAVASADLIALYLPRQNDEGFYDRMAPIFADCQLVLVEGDLGGDGIKVEAWRKAAGGSCLAHQHKDIRAVITDDSCDVDVPLWPRSDLNCVVDRVLSLIERSCSEELAGHRGAGPT